MHVIVSQGIGKCSEKNKEFINDDRVIALVVEGEQFKHDAAKMPEDTRFVFLPGSVTILKKDGRYSVRVRVNIDEGGYFVFYKEYFIQNIEK